MVGAMLPGLLSFSQSDTAGPVVMSKVADTLLPGYENSFPVKKNRSTIYLYNGEIKKGKIVTIYEDVLSFHRKKDLQLDPLPPPTFIAIDSIAVIYFRRNSFFNGMAAGALLGFLGGYAVGRSINTYNSETDRLWKSIKTGAAIMVPAAIIGALVGPIITRKRFEIWGSRNNLLGVMMKINLIE
jgi:hypothetical protein